LKVRAILRGGTVKYKKIVERFAKIAAMSKKLAKHRKMTT
jgi:hypothetical protein